MKDGSRSAVPIFFMLSGALLCVPKDESVKIFFEKRFKKIIIPFLFWSLVCGLIAKSADSDVTWQTVFSVIKQIPVEPTYFHLWFVYDIIALYTLVPIIRVYIKGASNRNLLYFIMLIFIPYSISVIFGDVLGMPLYSVLVVPTIGLDLGYFILGYYLRTVDITEHNRKRIYILGFGSLMLTIFGSIYLAMIEYPAYYILYKTGFITTLAISIALFLFFKSINVDGFANNHKKIWSTIESISQCSFGIYLIHALVITAKIPMVGKNVRELITNSALEVCIVLLLSWGIVYICKKSKYLKVFFG